MGVGEWTALIGLILGTLGTFAKIIKDNTKAMTGLNFSVDRLNEYMDESKDKFVDVQGSLNNHGERISGLEARTTVLEQTKRGE